MNRRAPASVAVTARGGVGPKALASPKSSTRATPSESTRMLLGFTSRWMTPRWCACWMASQTVVNMRTSGLETRPRPVLAQRDRGGAGVDRRALDELHHEVGPPVRSRAAVEHGDDVRMAEPRGEVDLALEPAARLGGRREPLAQHLHRDAAARADLGRDVDDALAALPDLAQVLVAGDRREAGSRRSIACRTSSSSAASSSNQLLVECGVSLHRPSARR